MYDEISCIEQPRSSEAAIYKEEITHTGEITAISNHICFLPVRVINEDIQKARPACHLKTSNCTPRFPEFF